MSRRWQRAGFVLLLAATLVLAACGQQGAQDAGGDDVKVEDPIGVVEVAPGDPVVLAFALAVEGPAANLGEDSRRGIEIALEEENWEILGHRIKLVGENTGCNAEGGQAAAQKLAQNTQIVAVIGTTCSSEARPAVPVFCRAGFAVISPSNTAAELTDPNRGQDYACYARTAHNDLVQGKVAAIFVHDQLKLTRVATIHDGSPYAEGLANVFAETFQQLGGTVTAQEAVQAGQVDMKPVLTRIAATQPELIFFPIFPAEGGHIAKQSREVKGLENVKLMGADGLLDPNFVKAAGQAATNMYLSSPDFSKFQSERYDQFLNMHREKYGGAPLSAFHAHAYDATKIILAAIKQVAKQKSDGTLLIGRKALQDAVFATKDFQGLTGNLTCGVEDPSVPKFVGDCGDPHIAIYQYSADNVADPDKNWPPQKIWSPD